MELSMSDYPRAPIHDAAIRFRVAENLLLSAEAKAKSEGMTLSELLRHALRRELREAA
jgi:antitoxin component of RelBE/YafQ-DinJ toxin-antitoxin module